MLEDVYGKKITKLSYPEEFRKLRARMTDDEWKALEAHIMPQLDCVEVGKVTSAGWNVPKNWDNTVYAPLYHKVARQDEVLAGMFYGSCFRLCVIHHKALWRCVKTPGHKTDPESGTPIDITLYWRVTE
jgi:hypothetical protein